MSALLMILPVFSPKMPPLGLGFLQSYLAKKSIKVDLLDLNNFFYNLSSDHLKKQWLVSCNTRLEQSILKIIKRDYPSAYNDAIERVLSYSVAGFSCFKSNFKVTLEIIKELKSKKRDIRIILGGPEITRQFFKTKGEFGGQLGRLADFLVVGEGEKPLYNYLTKNSAQRSAKFEQLVSLRGLAHPTYQDLKISNYPRKDALPIQFSRGCVRSCGFCSEQLLYKGFRRRSVKSVIEEIRYHKQNNQINYFVFFDSMINADSGALEDLCDQIIDNFGSVNWEAQIAVRGDMKDRLFDKMKKSGCYNLFVGVESGSGRTLKNMNKGFNPAEAVDFFKKLRSAGLFFGISMIVGYPGETDADFRESLEFMIKHKDLIPKIEQINPFTYYEGTQADQSGSYKKNKRSLERMDVMVRRIKRHKFKYTGAFIGNLIEKNSRT